MERKPFGVRFSQYEMGRLQLEARMVGWSVGKLIRFRALRGDAEQEKRIANLERMVGDVTQEQRSGK